MTSNGQFRAGDVVVVPFPYSDRFAEKRRPAVVISSGLAVEAGYVWVAMVTSSDGPVMTGDHLIADLVRTGLPAPSRVRAIKIACIEPSRIVRSIGRLATDDWRKVRHSLAQFLS